jgi:transposase
MTSKTRRRFTAEYKTEAVARLSTPGATVTRVAKELGISVAQLKIWRLEREAAGSTEAVARQQAEAAELQRLRGENKRLQEENEILRKASAFFAHWAGKP